LRKYRWLDIYETLPEGWVIDEHNSAPLACTVFITNGKSLFNPEFKRALLRVKINKE